MNIKTVLITGGSGLVGNYLVRTLEKNENINIIVCDINEPKKPFVKAKFIKADIRGDETYNIILKEKPDVVVHLAAVINTMDNRKFQYSIDVGGTQNVIRACKEAKVSHILSSSSAAAYGYHKDSPQWITEEVPLRGNKEFAYSDHKRIQEELFADLRKTNPEIKQSIFRISIILGPGLNNLITSLFKKPILTAVTGTQTAFGFVWVTDVSNVFEKAILENKTGIYNVAGDDKITMKQAGKIIGKPMVRIPAFLAKAVLTITKPLGLSKYGPEQVRFIQHRPLLLNTKLKEEFGYFPKFSSTEALQEYWKKRNEQET